MWDDQDGVLEAIVHAGSNWSNASYRPGCGHIQFGRGFVTPDIYDHEFMHAIDNCTARLIYANESAALDEAYADIWGYSFDQEDWELGEVRYGGSSDPIRDLADPPQLGQPDHYDDYVETESDKGGVHTNSGILNKTFYLLVEGDEHNGFAVSAIGLEKAERLYYDTHTHLLTRSAEYFEAADMTISQAQAYAVFGSYDFTTDDACQVVNAFASVGLSVDDRGRVVARSTVDSATGETVMTFRPDSEYRYRAPSWKSPVIQRRSRFSKEGATSWKCSPSRAKPARSVWASSTSTRRPRTPPRRTGAKSKPQLLTPLHRARAGAILRGPRASREPTGVWSGPRLENATTEALHSRPRPVRDCRWARHPSVPSKRRMTSPSCPLVPGAWPG